MELISVENSKNGWKIQYESRATDNIPVRVKYPSLSDIVLGRPTTDFFQAVAQFLPMAIAISHLDVIYWLQYGRVKAIKFKEDKDERAIQISIEANNDESFEPTTVTTHWIEFSSLMSLLQPDPSAPSLNDSVDELEQQVEKYINGDRHFEQLQLEVA